MYKFVKITDGIVCEISSHWFLRRAIRKAFKFSYQPPFVGTYQVLDINNKIKLQIKVDNSLTVLKA